MKSCSICGINHNNKFIPSEDKMFIYSYSVNPNLCKECEDLWLSWRIEELRERKITLRDTLVEKVRLKIRGLNK